MQNRFGLKDFVLLVLVLATGVSVWISMLQRDRHWTQLQEISRKLAEVDGNVGRVERSVATDLATIQDTIGDQLEDVRARLEAGVVARAPADGAAAPPGPRGRRDESWAREGVSVEWPEPWGFVNDPR